jgi:hypothetical protein
MNVNTNAIRYDNDAEWSAAIQEAEKQISSARRNIRALQKSISFFRDKLKNGEPWPRRNITKKQ